jgi:hypothetical protein
MASTKSTKAAVLDEDLDATEAELSPKQIINEGIDRVLSKVSIDVQHGRYKAMRAIAFEAFSQAIEAGSFDDLVDEAIANIGELPSGWEIERSEKEAAEKTTKKASAKAAPKAASKKAATPAAKSARRRPTR